jgi:ribokinase
MDEDLKKRLLEKLKQLDKKTLNEINIVLMPDFFIDHFLTMNNINKETSRIKEIYNRGGGNLPNIPQKIHQGGNAANTSLALSRLGVKSKLICKTDKLGLHLLKFFLSNNSIDLSGVKTNGKIAITTAMEFGNKHTNILIGDPGSISNFNFENLDDKDLHNISNSNITCILNWGLNKKGTKFAKDVLNYSKKYDVKTFFDSGDPSHRKKDIPSLMKNVITSKNLDILGLNENEINHYCNLNLSEDGEQIINAAISLKKKTNARIDLHTASFACSVNEELTTIRSIKLSNIRRVTGAGDAWNAGNLFAESLNFKSDERLLFSNLVAGCYISSSDALPPDIKKIICFLEKNK